MFVYGNTRVFFNLFKMNDRTRRVLNLITCFFIFVALFIYFWKWIDPRLIDFNQQPIFLIDFNFLNEYLVLPGGLATYLSLFISQFFHYALAGTFILMLVLYFIMILSKKLLSVFFLPDYVFVFRLLPVFLLTCLHSKYSYTLKPDIIIIVSLILTAGYHYFINKRFLFRIIVFIVFSALSIIFFGGISMILFAFLAILCEIKNKKSGYIRIVLLYVIVSSILPFIVGSYTPYMNFKNVLFDIFIPEKYYKPFLALYPLFLFYPVIIILGLIFSGKMLNRKYTDLTKKGRLFITSVILVAVPVILLLFTIRFSYNSADKALIELNYYAENKDWGFVLRAAKKLSLKNRLVLFQINRALFHKEMLLDNLFDYNQLWGEDGLILTRYYNSRILMPISDYYFDLGYIRESLHWAYEALTKYQYQPVVLKRIALSNLILGEYQISEKFLTILSKSVIHRNWAAHYMEYLNNKDLIESDPYIQKKRHLMPKHDYYANLNEPALDLYYLLKENPDNKMAFEYYIAISLLKHDIGNVIKNLHYLSELNYGTIPRHIEEAILLYVLFQKGKDIQLGPYHISSLTTGLFNKYNTILYVKHKNDLHLAQPDLFQYFNNTFWYYLHYVSPITTKKEIKERSIE